MAVDPVCLGNLHFARQFVTRGKATVGDAALDAVGNLPPQGDAGTFLHAHGVLVPRNLRFVTKQSWRSATKLSISIDNLDRARPLMTSTVRNREAQRKAAMTVLAHS